MEKERTRQPGALASLNGINDASGGGRPVISPGDHGGDGGGGSRLQARCIADALRSCAGPCEPNLPQRGRSLGRTWPAPRQAKALARTVRGAASSELAASPRDEKPVRAARPGDPRRWPPGVTRGKQAFLQGRVLNTGQSGSWWRPPRNSCESRGRPDKAFEQGVRQLGTGRRTPLCGARRGDHSAPQLHSTSELPRGGHLWG